MEKSKVYFSKEITPKNVVRLYEVLQKELVGKVAVKVHSGEEGNQNYLKPEFMRPMVERVKGTIVECNTAYEGERNSTEKHKKLMENHGWSKHFEVDIMDAEGDDIVLEIPKGKVIKENYVGKNMKNYDSMLVLSHFKGHPMGGYGGALKQLSIGCSSTAGKVWIHTAGQEKDQAKCWDKVAQQNDFLVAMAEAATSVVEYFKGNMAFINIMCNMSVDCDCCAIAEDPCIKDIGIVASLDPVAIDQACIDLVKASEDEGKEHFLERVHSRNGTYTIDVAAELGIGNKEYDLIELD